VKITKSKLPKTFKKWRDIEDGEVFRASDGTICLAIAEIQAVRLDGTYEIETNLELDEEVEMLEAELIIKE